MSFLSFLKAVGRDFKKDWIPASLAQGAGAVASSYSLQTLGPTFNSTVSAVVWPNRRPPLLASRTAPGAQKLADVLANHGACHRSRFEGCGKMPVQSA